MSSVCIHYDMTQEPRTLVANFDKQDEEGMFTSTEVGFMPTATLFPTYLHPKLLVHWNDLQAARQLVEEEKAKIYKFMNDASQWRKQQ